MYRGIQELINNAIKHVINGIEVLVKYICEMNKVDIMAEGNDSGIKTQKIEEVTSGTGVSNLRTRGVFKGDLDFHSDENAGTTVNIHINIDAA